MHKCDNPSCINLFHMCLGTQRENRLDCVSKKRHAFGENHGLAKLTNEQVEYIRLDNSRQEQLVKKYGVTRQQISRIQNGKARMVTKFQS